MRPTVKRMITLKVNGKKHEVSVKAHWTLLDVLRNELKLKGTKKGCETGECGMCTVLLDGKAVNSCLILAMQAEGKDIVTIEGLSQSGELNLIQEAFIDSGAIACGYCTPGLVMSAKALLDERPNPSEEEVRESIAGNLCRCLGYTKNVRAILLASERMRER